MQKQAKDAKLTVLHLQSSYWVPDTFMFLYSTEKKTSSLQLLTLKRLLNKRKPV